MSRLTLLPLVLVGSSERATVPPLIVGVSPLARAPRRDDSKSTRPARKPGVCRLAMLSAVTRLRWARPLSAACSAVDVASAITALLANGWGRTRSASGYAEGTRERVRGPPIRGEVVLSVLLPHRHVGVRA